MNKHRARRGFERSAALGASNRRHFGCRAAKRAFARHADLSHPSPAAVLGALLASFRIMPCGMDFVSLFMALTIGYTSSTIPATVTRATFGPKGTTYRNPNNFMKYAFNDHFWPTFQCLGFIGVLNGNFSSSWRTKPSISAMASITRIRFSNCATIPPTLWCKIDAVNTRVIHAQSAA